METQKFRGTFTAIITPFQENGAIDLLTFRELIEKQISAGVEGIVVLGTTGESPTITPDEHKNLIAEAVRIVSGRVLVIAGTGSNSTAEAIEYSQSAEQSGADGLLQVTPYYNKPTQKGLYEHFSTIAKATKLPIILYNIEGRCGVNITTETVIKLSQIENIVAVKDASGNLQQVADVINKTPDNFSVLTGNDDQIVDTIKLGGAGVVSVISNILPQETIKLTNLALLGNIAEAEEKMEQLSEFIKNLFIETNPQPIKTIMAREGLCQEIFRLPMTTMLEENKEKLFKSWENLNLK